MNLPSKLTPNQEAEIRKLIEYERYAARFEWRNIWICTGMLLGLILGYIYGAFQGLD